MALLFRWLLRLVTGLVAITIVAVLIAYYLASGSLPTYDKRLAVSGTNSDIEIIRDHAAIPHILAETNHDAFYGLGYVHAQDRLWQMVMMRRTVQGRLSEVFGRRTLDTDRLMRQFDLNTLAARSVQVLSPDTRAALAAYSAGVNARISEINADSLGRGAPEFFLFKSAIAPWTPEDSVALVKLMALQMSGHMQREILRARTSLALGGDDERLKDILPDIPGSGVAALPRYASVMPNTPMSEPLNAFARAELGQDFWPIADDGMAGASNAFAAAPSRSAGQGSLLANDPHMALTAPAVWYLARMDLNSGPVIGGTIPGIPAILVGRSNMLSWGLTTAYLDDQDLYVEQINPDNPSQVKGPNGWETLRKRRTIIDIKDESPVSVDLAWSSNGPLLPETMQDLAQISPRGHRIALSWTGFSATDTSLDTAIGIMRARTRGEAIAVAKAHVAPAQMLTLADQTGIATQLIGAMPSRHLRHQGQGRIPSLGAIASNRWLGTLPYSDNPRFDNPPGGIVGNTNNKVVDRPFPKHVTFDWGDSQRVQRWQEIMGRRKAHTSDSFREAQLDVVSPASRTLLPLVGKDLWYTTEAAEAGSADRQRQRALALLADWNGEMNAHLPEPLIYAAWMRALQARLIQDDLGPVAASFTHVDPLFIERVYRDIDGASAWCDIKRSSAIETCSDIARLSLDDALVWISETYGDALESLRWGEAHQATQDHQTLGQVPILRYFVNIRQSTSGGDHTLMRGKTAGKGTNPFHNVHAAGYRGIYDFSDPDSSMFIMSTGQSGHFLSRHYDDQGQLWRRGEYLNMSLNEDLARAASVGVTYLVKQ